MFKLRVNRSYLLYLLAAYATVLIVEYFSAASGDSKIFQTKGWFIFFLIWYGLVYGLAYKFMRHWRLWQIFLFWALAGPIIENVLFRGSIKLSDLGYGFMIALPFWLHRKLESKKVPNHRISDGHSS